VSMCIASLVYLLPEPSLSCRHSCILQLQCMAQQRWVALLCICKPVTSIHAAGAATVRPLCNHRYCAERLILSYFAVLPILCATFILAGV
jgi:hypothetical protein